MYISGLVLTIMAIVIVASWALGRNTISKLTEELIISKNSCIEYKGWYECNCSMIDEKNKKIDELKAKAVEIYEHIEMLENNHKKEVYKLNDEMGMLKYDNENLTHRYDFTKETLEELREENRALEKVIEEQKETLLSLEYGYNRYKFHMHPFKTKLLKRKH